MNNDLTQDELKYYLRYNPDTGLFIWLNPLSTNVKTGHIAGSKDSCGYIQIKIKNKKYSAHRLAWLYVYGSLPKEMIDHINGNPSDNRIINLREADNRLNMSNLKRDLPRGVDFHKRSKKYRAQIWVNGNILYLGLHHTAEQAFSARLAKEAEFGLTEQYQQFEAQDTREKPRVTHYKSPQLQLPFPSQEISKC